MSKEIPKYKENLSDFVGDLRSGLFSQEKAAEYFGVSRPTISRWENDIHKPPLGYLACLAMLWAKRQDDAPTKESYCQELLHQVNEAIRDSYFMEADPFNDWKKLCAVAEKYLRPTTVEPGGKEPIDRRLLGLLLIGLGVSLLVGLDISLRFLSGAPDRLSFLVAALLCSLFILAAVIALTPVGTWLAARLTILRASERQMKAGSVFLLAAGLIIFHWGGLFQFAVIYNNWGVQARQSNRPSEAKAYFDRAIKLAPDFYQARYNLGSFYEDGAQYELARNEYRLAAIEGGLDVAYNNLARLYILAEAYADAATLLKQGLPQAKDDEAAYDMLKNLGWAYLEQENYPEAEKYLREAMALKPGAAPAHCLLAELLDRQQLPARAVPEWEACLISADSRNRDEDEWIKTARKRLLVQEAQK